MPNNAKVTLYGRVIAEPQQRQTQNNNTQLTLKVSVSTTKRAQPGSQYPYESDLYDVIVYGKSAESLLQTVKAKCFVWATGALQMGKPWQDNKNHEWHVSPQLIADTVVVTSGGNWVSRDSGSQNAHAPAPANEPAEEVNTDDAPF